MISSLQFLLKDKCNWDYGNSFNDHKMIVMTSDFAQSQCQESLYKLFHS